MQSTSMDRENNKGNTNQIEIAPLAKRDSNIDTFNFKTTYITNQMIIQILSSLNGYFTQTFCDKNQEICEKMFKKQKYFSLYTLGLKSVFEQHSS